MLFHDLRYALRQLRRAPGFSFTVVLTLALSVGAATAVFCVIDTVVLRPLPFVTPDQIVAIQATARAGYTQPASWPSYQDETRQLTTFSALAGYSSFKKITIEAPASGPTAIDCVRSTDNFFQVFGVQPLLGRTYLPGEQLDGRNEIVVLSYDAWQFYFNADRKIIGKPVTLDGRSFTVIGVMPAGFRFPLSEHNEVYIPRLLDESWMQRRGAHWLQTVGRIKDGATVQQAQADLTHVFNDIGRSYPDTDGGRIVKPVLLADSITAKTKGPLWTLLAAVLAPGYWLCECGWLTAGAWRKARTRDGHACGNWSRPQAAPGTTAHGGCHACRTGCNRRSAAGTRPDHRHADLPRPRTRPWSGHSHELDGSACRCVGCCRCQPCGLALPGCTTVGD